MGNKKINPLFKLLGIGNIYNKFDSKVAKLGWVAGCSWLLDNLAIKYNNLEKNNGAVIVYANHPTGLDPYLLTAAMGRNDSYFWGDLYQSKKGKSIAKHIIPIAPKPFWSILRRPLSNWPGYIYMRLTTPSLNQDETKKINSKSIKKTIELLKKGKQIIIFPSGGEYEFLKPAKGLSVVIEKCKQQKIKVKLVKFQINKLSEIGLLFHFIFKTNIKVNLDYN